MGHLLICIILEGLVDRLQKSRKRLRNHELSPMKTKIWLKTNMTIFKNLAKDKLVNLLELAILTNITNMEPKLNQPLKGNINLNWKIIHKALLVSIIWLPTHHKHQKWTISFSCHLINWAIMTIICIHNKFQLGNHTNRLVMDW